MLQKQCWLEQTIHQQRNQTLEPEQYTRQDWILRDFFQDFFSFMIQQKAQIISDVSMTKKASNR